MMDALAIDRDEALAILESRLGRAPQDVLEAAVVLEAWAGLPGDVALALAADILAERDEAPVEPSGDRPDETTSEAGWSDAIAVLVALATLVAWSPAIRRGIGDGAFATAVRLSLPLTLGMQWLIGARYLIDRRWAERFTRDRKLLALGALGAVALAATAPGTAPLLASELCVVWLVSALLARRAPILLVVLLGVTTGALELGLAPLATLGMADVAGLAMLAVLLPRDLTTPYRGRPWRVALPAGVLGASLGLLLVIDPGGMSGLAPTQIAVALSPAAFAALWGGRYLSRLWRAIDQDLHQRSVDRANRPAVWTGTSRVALGALLRVALALGVLTPLAIAISSAAGWPPVPAAALAGGAAFAFAGTVAMMLEAFERTRLALIAVALGCGAIAATSAVPDAPEGAGLVVGPVAVALLGCLFAAPILRYPARLLASIVR